MAVEVSKKFMIFHPKGKHTDSNIKILYDDNEQDVHKHAKIFDLERVIFTATTHHLTTGPTNKWVFVWMKPYHLMFIQIPVCQDKKTNPCTGLKVLSHQIFKAFLPSTRSNLYSLRGR